MSGFLDDLRFALRSLRRSPWLALTALGTMALGIGLTATIYGVIDAAMLRGLPFPDGDRVVSVIRTVSSKGYTTSNVPLRDFFALRERQREMEGLAAFAEQTMNLSGDERPERVDGARVSANLFPLLRVRPALGRGLLGPDDRPGAPLVAVVGDALWRSRYQADPHVLGRTVRVDGETATIVGVMPPGMRFPVIADLWVPLRVDAVTVAAAPGRSSDIVGRLRPGRRAEDASRELGALQSALSREHPDDERGLRAQAVPYVAAFMGGENGQQLWTMMAAVVLVLVIACVNVANLLLVRAAGRAREVAVRSALGASRRRVAALFLTESLALSLAGAVAGIGVAWIGMHVFTRAVADTQPPFWIVLRLDARVLLFVAAATAIAALVAGCLPALEAARSDVNGVLKDGARGSSGFRVGRVSRLLVIAELALSCALLVGAGMMVSTITHLRTRDYGVDTRGTLVARVLLPSGASDSTRRARFSASILARLRDEGVSNVALASALPVADGAPTPTVVIEGERRVEPTAPPIALRIAVTAGYFAAVGARPVEGRDFDARDVAGAPDVAFVNREFVQRRFAGESPIGRRLVVGSEGKGTRVATIVGVAPDVSPGGTSAQSIQSAVYVPLAQWPDRRLAIAIRSAGDPLALAPRLRAAVAAVEPDLALSDVGTLAALIDSRTWFYRVFGGAFTIFGLAALFLAALGLYAVMAASVVRRRRELGVRVALGAETRGILALVLRQGVTQVMLGGAVGLALGVALSQLLRGLLFGVRPGDPAVMLGVVGVLAATGLLASIVPALRASRVDPMAALRVE